MALRIQVAHGWHVFAPEHGEVGFGHLVLGRQIEPDLEQLSRVGRIRVAQGKHFAVHNALARSEPLHVARAKAGGGAQRVRVVDMPLADYGHRFKAPVWVRRKAGNGLAVVHAPTVFARKVLAQIASAQGGVRPHGGVATRVGVHVVHAKQKRVYRGPRRRGQGRGAQDAGAGSVGHRIHLLAG